MPTLLDKPLHRRNLEQINVVIEDSTENSPDYFVVSNLPSEFCLGKNAFNIRGNFDNLVKKSPINIEILDSSNKPVSFEIISYKDESQNVTISVQFDSDVAPGPIQIILVGIAKNVIPNNTFNVRWSKKINFNIMRRNNSRILFKNAPSVTVDNILNGISRRNFSGSIRTTMYNNGLINFYTPKQNSYLGPNIGGEGILRPNLRGVKTSTAEASYTTTVSKNATRTPAPFHIQKGAFINNDYGFTCNVSGGNFISDMVGGTINILTPTGSYPFIPDGYIITGSQIYSSIIDRVVNSSSLRTRDPYIVQIQNVSNSKDIKQHKFTSFGYSSYQITHSVTASSITILSNSQSYLDIYFNNLDLASGDIYRIKTYFKPVDMVSDYSQIGDSIIEPQNFLIDTGSYNKIPNREGDYLLRGIFHPTITESDYWEINTTKSTDFAGNIATTPFGFYEKQNNYLIDAVKIQPPTGTLPLSESHMTVFGNKFAKQILDIKSGHYYTIGFNSFVEPHNSGSSGSWEISVWVSGTAIIGDNYLGETLGKKVGVLNTTSDRKRFDRAYFTFQADKNGKANIYFVVKQGAWHISDVELLSYNNEGFTPHQVKMTLQVENNISNSFNDFKFEYYTFDHKLADYVTYVNNVKLIKESIKGFVFLGGVISELEAGGG